ncbi:TNT domain-containing protein [Streptomyces caatingaensis]|uniref:TNT domain-containing protein n=1 Tax=Streptomyces caatingaensis TaxID=1678637 RepID=UPI0006727B6B|nr:TNT domain-containing protein [Streptomyces caatingaensis]
MRATVGISMATAVAACGALLGPAAPAATAHAPAAAQPTECLDPYQGDWSLGPKDVPAKEPVAALVKDWKRFGIYPTARSFLNDWKTNDWQWAYPANDGFAGKPVATTVGPGAVLDRFGGTGGSFVSPAGAGKPVTYGERSVPPSNLRTYRQGAAYDAECNYHLYKVKKPVTGLKGAIAPAFGQPGGGTQIKLDKDVKSLLGNGSLEDVTPGRSRTPRRTVSAAPSVTLAGLPARLRRAGVPDALYRLPGLREPRLPATEFHVLRRAAGGRWEVAVNERGKERVLARYADGSRAASRLYDEVVGHLG